MARCRRARHRSEDVPDMLREQRRSQDGRSFADPLSGTRLSRAARRSGAETCRWRILKPAIAGDGRDDRDSTSRAAGGSDGVNALAAQIGVLVITHYNRFSTTVNRIGCMS